MTRYLALGDSYTAGEGVGEGESFPARVGAACMPPLHAPVDRIARTGWTTGELLSAIREAPPDGHYDLVSLLIGVNNQYRGLSIEAYRADLKALLPLAIHSAGGDPAHVVVLSIPDWGVTPFAEGRDRARIASEIDAFNRVAESEAHERGAIWVDVTADSRTHPHDLVADGLHPSAAAYRRWAALVLDAIQL